MKQSFIDEMKKELIAQRKTILESLAGQSDEMKELVKTVESGDEADVASDANAGYDSGSDSSSENGQHRRYYRYWRYNNDDEETETTGSYFTTFILKLLQTIVGVFFFRYSFFIIPFGFIICIAVIANGIKGMVKSLSGIKRLIKINKK